MRTTRQQRGSIPAVLLLALAAQGCGSDEPPARPDILEAPAEDLHGAATKATLYDFRARIRKRGVDAAKQELPLLLENFENYEDEPLGQYRETYDQIVEKLKALETTLGGSPTKEQVVQAAEEIGTLADKLPGKAQENPEVD
jgi:hypothetical protein